MKEASEYQHYRARLVKPLFYYVPSRLWGKWVKLGRWTRYGRAWLVRQFEADFWPTEARGGALNRRFEIDGRDNDNQAWEAVSEWRRSELRIAGDVATALRAGEVSLAAREDAEIVAERMREVRTLCVPKPGLGEAATHLIDHRPGYREEIAVRILRLLKGRDDIYPADLKIHLKNGRRRTSPCRFCEVPDR